MIAEILEAAMVISFGVSWPMNIIKSVKSKTAKGRSMLFIWFIFSGYIFGIVGKIVSGNITYVFAFYVLNLIMVTVDLVLCIKNRRNDRISESSIVSGK